MRRFSARRVHFSLAVAMAAVVAVAAPSVAQQEAPDRGPIAALQWDEGARRGQDERGRKLQERGSAQAKESRRRSRDAHRGKSRGQALDLAKDKFGPMVLRRPWQPLRLDDGQRVERYLSDRSARIEEGDKKTLVDSSLPLRSTVGTGELEPVDLTLKERAGAFAPRNPLVAALISKQIADGVRFPAAGYGLRLDGALGVESPLVVEDKVFYGNAATDTDLLVAPTPTGLEVSLQIRSVESPEEYSLRFDLPHGATLRTTDEPIGAAEIVRGEERIALITPPKAFDADQFPVPVSYEVRGAALVVKVAHRAADALYPLYVDPVIDNYRLDGAGNRVYVDDAFAAWNFVRDHGAIYNSRNGRYGNGLYVYTQPGNYYVESNFGYWSWTAPRQSHIERVDFGYVNHTHNYQGSCVLEGIYAPSAGRYDEGHWVHPPGYLQPDRYPSSPWYAYSSPAGEQSNRNACWDLSGNYKTHYPSRYGATTGNQVIYGLTMVSNFTRSYESLTYMFGAAMHLNDRENPSFTSTAPASSNGWVDDGFAKHSVTPGASDPGLGMWAFALYLPNSQPQQQFLNSSGQSVGNTTAGACDGTHAAPCATNASATYSYTLTEGDNLIGVDAFDVLGKGAGGQQWRQRVDRTAPDLKVEGDLRTSAFVNGGDSMTVTVKDGVANGTDTEKRSGVRSVEIKVDNARADYYEDPCAPECAATVTRTFTLDPATYDEGPHTIEVIAKDRLNHSSTDSWSVNSDSYQPIVTLDGPVYDADEGVLTAGVHTLDVDALDGDADSGESGVESIEVQVDGERRLLETQNCSGGNCDMLRSWTLDTSTYDPGDYTITVLVTDEAGNVAEHELVVRLDHDPAIGSQTIDAAAVPVRTDGGAGERAGTSVASVGDINGDEVDDVVIGAPRANHNGRNLSGSAYVVLGRSSGTADLSDPSAAAFRIDGAAALARAGASVASAGDVNGDGIGDLLVGAPYADRPEDGGTAPLLQPSVFVVFGSTALQNIDLASLGTRGFRIDGPLAGGGLGGLSDRHALPFGYALGGRLGGLFGAPGDVNGDGRDDVVVGASTDANNLRVGSGSAYVIFGKSDTAPVPITTLGQSGFRIDGAAAGDRAGYSVAVAGDVDNDGLADILVGAPSADRVGRQDAGTTHLVYGKADTGSVDLASAACRCYQISGAAAGDQFGFSLAPLGDDDGDELDDFAVGGRTAYFLYGQGETTPVDLAATYQGYALRPPSEASGEPAVIAPGGDVNSDLTRDVLIGFPSANGGRGALYTFFGFPVQTADVDLGALAGQRGARLVGNAPGDRFGSSAAALENLTLEQPGLVVGAPGAENDAQTDSGSTYVVSDEAFAIVGGFDPSTGASIAGRRTRRQRCKRPGSNDQPFNSSNYTFAKPSDHAICRKTDEGRTEITEWRKVRNAQGKAFDRVPRGRINRRVRGTRHLKPNSEMGGRNYHDLYDSLENKIGSIEQLPSGQYRLYNENGEIYGTTRRNGTRPQLVVQGEGCVIPYSKRGTYAIIYVVSRGRGQAPDGSSVDMAFRGFVNRNALPDQSLGRGQSNNNVINSAPAACGRRADYRDPPDTIAPIASAGFDGTTDKYQGQVHTRTSERCRTLDKRERDPNCGRGLEDYNVRDAFPSVLPLVTTTAGVFGGGIINGLIRVPNGPVAGTPTRELDHIRYLDPNVPCTRLRVAQWFRTDGAAERTQPLLGWYARRVDGGPARTAGCSS